MRIPRGVLEMQAMIMRSRREEWWTKSPILHGWALSCSPLAHSVTVRATVDVNAAQNSSADIKNAVRHANGSKLNVDC